MVNNNIKVVSMVMSMVIESMVKVSRYFLSELCD